MEFLRKRTQVPRVFQSSMGDRLVILPNEDVQHSTSNGRPIGPEYYFELKFMKEHGIDVSILSLANPWLNFLSENEAIPLATELNNDLNQMCFPSFEQITF